jgi:hypothetical protein
MNPKRLRRDQSKDTTLPFDVTQEIDPLLGDEFRRTPEPTLTQGDFDDTTLVLPDKPKRRS